MFNQKNSASLRYKYDPAQILTFIVIVLFSTFVISKLSAFPLKWIMGIFLSIVFFITLSQIKNPKYVLLTLFTLSTLIFINARIYRDDDIIRFQTVMSGYSLDLRDITLALLYLIWLKESLSGVSRQISRRHLFNLPIVSFFLFTVWTSISIIRTESFLVNNAFIAEIQYLQVLLILWYLINNIRDKNHVYALLIGAGIGCSLQSLLGVGQKLLGRTINIPVISPKQITAFGVTGAGWEGGRVEGAFRHPNQLAKLLNTFIPVFLYIGIFHKMKLYQRTVLLGISFLCLLAVLYTLSRSGWVGLGISFAIGFVIIAYHKRVLLKTLLISTLLFFIITPPILLTDNPFSRRIYNTSFSYTSPTYSRIPQFKAALNYIIDKPFLGVGPMNYVLKLREYDDTLEQLPVRRSRTVHNTFLYYCAENGIPALLLIIVFFSSILYVGFRYMNRYAPPLNYVMIGFSAGILSNIIALTYTIFPLFQQWYLWIPVGIIYAIHLNFEKISPENVLDAPSNST
ncbi:MAG: hypothetical protein GF307_07920 [candidate division Zixibacteria bacterium]|nr:hypothetical protein [candidate division Zixibacteria bacterium]